MRAIVVADGFFKETQRDRTFKRLNFLVDDEVVVNIRFRIGCSGKP